MTLFLNLKTTHTQMLYSKQYSILIGHLMLQNSYSSYFLQERHTELGNRFNSTRKHHGISFLENFKNVLTRDLLTTPKPYLQMISYCQGVVWELFYPTLLHPSHKDNNSWGKMDDDIKTSAKYLSNVFKIKNHLNILNPKLSSFVAERATLDIPHPLSLSLSTLKKFPMQCPNYLTTKLLDLIPFYLPFLNIPYL